MIRLAKSSTCLGRLPTAGAAHRARRAGTHGLVQGLLIMQVGCASMSTVQPANGMQRGGGGRQ
jgi:hypothetical protein